ncbi:polyphenol oxidase family protein [Helicobacter bilis]|uniref:polyphenol oxidase family protein n=1 Tax=Helicobacter bilis TaxID=37372 RepID=UPI00248DFF30|nr:polyphenol oxidase family protein [Helicobacter bilis]
MLPNQCDEILVGDGDGIICDNPNLVLMSMVADCNPILVYAKSQNVFAVLHAGRLGVCSKILTHALLLFMRDYGVKTQDICIFIGASIRKCCYEIDKNLALQLIQEFGEKYVVCEDNRYKFDMIGLLCDEIESFGISLSQVEIYPSCSCCDESYFSYRRENVAGRFGLFANLCD